MKNKIATIILNRNTPKLGNSIYEHLLEYERNISDIFLIEAGSEKNLMSDYFTWHNNEPEVVKKGLRYPRGMNFGLFQLWKENKFNNYDYFFLITNDTVLPKREILKTLQGYFEKIDRLGLISPCGKLWPEIELLNDEKIGFTWYLQNHAYLISRKCLQDLIDFNGLDYKTFLFDGNNFRGYGTEMEIIAKCYINNWACAITSAILIEENETELENNHLIINTEKKSLNLKLYVEEGLAWMKKKYGFNSRWDMLKYNITLYNEFFKDNPEFLKYKI